MKGKQKTTRIQAYILLHQIIGLLACWLVPNLVVAQQVPFRFVENQHQWEKPTLFRADIPNGFLFLNPQSATYAFYDATMLQARHGHGTAKPGAQRIQGFLKNTMRAHAFEVFYENSKVPERVIGNNPLDEKYHYFLGKDTTRWATDVRAYEQVIYEELYTATDLRFYPNDGQLKYEFIVRPGGNPDEIALRYEGHLQLKLLDNGNLYIQTSVNTLTEQKPYCYQVVDGKTVEVPSRFVVEGNRLRFDFPQGFDASRPLVIDPVLVFSTFSGSVSTHWGNTATFDEQGNLYNGGSVFGADFPVTSGAYQIDFANEIDIAIQKFDSTGSQLEYSTFIGGDFTEIPHSLIVNSLNQLVILGSTSSADYPVLPTAFDTTFSGGTPRAGVLQGVDYQNGSDLIVTVLAPGGRSLRGSTFLGGTQNDGLNEPSKAILSRNYGDQFRSDVITDRQNNIYLVSTTNSPDFPVSANALSDTLRGVQDALLVKLNSTASDLIWATFLGGSDLDAAYSIKLKSDTEILVAGGTASTDFPTTAGGLHPTYRGGSADGFVMLVSEDGQSLLASTYIGTEQYDQVYLSDIDPAGGVAVFGQTQGPYQVTAGVYSNANSGQFIHKLGNGLGTTIFSTVIGSGVGTPDICPTAFLVNECSNIYLTGWGGQINSQQDTNYIGGNTFDMPVTTDAVKLTTDGSDFYLAVLSSDASSLLYGTFFGGNQALGEHVDGGTSRFDKRGIVYHSVCACGNNGYPATSGAYATTNLSANSPGGLCNNAAFKFDLAVLEADFDISEANGCAPHEVLLTNTSRGGKSFEWEIEGIGASTAPDEVQVTFDTPGTYLVRLTARDPSTCVRTDAVVDTIVVNAQNFAVGSGGAICNGEQIQLSASGAESYRWRPSASLDNPDIPNPIASPTVTTVYEVTMINEFGCEVDSQVTVTVYPEVRAEFEARIVETCDTLQVVEITNNSIGADNLIWDKGTGDLVVLDDPGRFTYDAPGIYQVVLVANSENCFDTDTVEVNVDIVPSSFFYKNVAVSPPLEICEGEPVQLFAAGGVAYEWSEAVPASDRTLPNPLVAPDTTTTYGVRILNERGCFVDTTVQVTVTQDIELDFQLSLKGFCGNIPSLEFENETEAGDEVTFEWLMGNGEVLDGKLPEAYFYPDTGVFEVTLVAQVGECLFTETRSLIVEQVVPPNAITPNGDGKNEFFVIESRRSGWKLKVYSRWGDLLYESEDYQNDFGGEELSESTYLYLLTSPLGVECKGWFKVLR